MSPRLPDVEQIVTGYLRAAPEVAALVGDRVFSVFPSQAGSDAFLLVQRIGGFPALGRPLWLDQADLQLDAYGGPKRAAFDLMAAAWEALEHLPGAYPSGVITAVTYGPLRWQPDPTYPVPRPRYIGDVAVFAHPGAVAPATRRSTPTVAPVGATP